MWALIASLYIGNVMLLVLNLPLVGLWVKLLQIPRPYLYAGILTFAAWAPTRSTASTTDLWILLVDRCPGLRHAAVRLPDRPAR